jgi:hypothetical protein
MRPLSAVELLDVWEEGYARSPIRRALLLLTAACPGTPPERLAQLSIGQRDARLLRLREWTFGPQLDCLLACPGCGEQLELSFQVADIGVTGEEDDDGAALSLALDGYQVQFRLPNSLDMIAVTEGPAIGSPRSQLLERCLVAIQLDDQDRPADELPANVLDALVERMTAIAPQADVQLAVECPACGHGWGATFDIVSFFWSELDTWAQRTLHEVHTLARAYGWREADILAMSAWRRGFYLEMVSG